MAQPIKYPPNTIHLGGEKVEVGDVAAGAAITPGLFLERYNSSGTPLYRPVNTLGVRCNTIALNQSMMNLGVDDQYAIGSTVEAGIGAPGSTWWALIASGGNVANGDLLEVKAGGKVGAVTTGTAVARALESKNNSAGPGDARIRIELI